MAKKKPSENETVQHNIPKEHRSNPCWIAYMHPYVFVVPDDERPWKLDLDEINRVDYNHAKLLRVVTKIKCDSSGLDGLVCYDGTLALPRYGRFQRKEDAIDYFNKVFLKFNLNGFYVGYVDHRDVLYGRLEEKWSIRNHEMGGSAESHLHSKNRWRVGSNMDSIRLDSPRVLNVSEFHAILSRGEASLNKIPNLSAKFLNIGLTEIRFRNWDIVLSNLWITAEQLVDYLWYNRFLNAQSYHPDPDIPGRKVSMKEDSRTWSAGIKQEMLFQAKIIDENILKYLFDARRVRNKLVHEGRSVNEETACNLFQAVSDMLKVALGEEHGLLYKSDDRGESVFSQVYNTKEDLFEDWKSLPDENIIESILGPDTTKNAKLG